MRNLQTIPNNQCHLCAGELGKCPRNMLHSTVADCNTLQNYKIAKFLRVVVMVLGRDRGGGGQGD